MVYVIALTRTGNSFKVTIPKKWIEENLEPSSRIMYMVPKDIGIMELYSERRWYEKYLSKGSNESDKGTPESGEGSDGSGLACGVIRIDEPKGPPSTDYIAEKP